MVIFNDYVNIYLTTWDYASNVLLSEKGEQENKVTHFCKKRERNYLHK